MKKLLVLCSLLAFLAVKSTETQAQVELKTTFTGTKTTDTCTNTTDTTVFVYNGINMKNGCFVVRAIRLTGSPILTVLLETSADKLYWFPRQAASQVNGDTLNLQPVANGVVEKSLAIPAGTGNYLYYRVRILGHTAATARVVAWAIPKRD